MKLTVITSTGYKAEISTAVAADGAAVEVKTAAYIFKGVLSPWIVLKSYTGADAQKRAQTYANRLVAALMDEEGK